MLSAGCGEAIGKKDERGWGTHPSIRIPRVAVNEELSWEREYDLVQNSAGQLDRFGSSHGFP